MGAGRTLGIDLGTTNTCAAIFENGKARVVRSRLGHTTIPSIVAFDEQRTPIVGHNAARRMTLDPAEVIYGSKRLIGRRYAAGVQERFQPHFHYRLAPDTDGFVGAAVGDQVVSMVAVAALILDEIRQAAQSALGQAMDRAVITVPAYFNENQRSCVREAGERAGLEVVRIINEPTAAALCYGQGGALARRVLVYDLGGGTFDVSIVRIDGSLFTVEGVDGDTFLGGFDFDRRLTDFVLNKQSERLGQRVTLDPVNQERLRLAVQEAKHALSLQNQTVVQVPRLRTDQGRVLDLGERVTRDEFENLTAELVDQTLRIARRALDRAKLRPADIDQVLLVGGQTRMPLIHQRVEQLFEQAPSRNVHPDEVVALGAALATNTHGRKGAVGLSDVVPLPIGIADSDGRFQTIIPRNTSLPHEATTTIAIPHGCRSLKLAVFQGDQAHAFDNDYLGALVVEPIEPTEKERECHFVFSLDQESILSVTAWIPGAGRRKKRCSLATHQTPDEVLSDMRAERIRLDNPEKDQRRPTEGRVASTGSQQTPAATKGVAVAGSARREQEKKPGLLKRITDRLRGTP
jgi:molecular chaperone DnaK